VGRRFGVSQCNLLFLFSFPLFCLYPLLGGAPKELGWLRLKSLMYIFVYASLGRLGKLHAVQLEHSATVESRPSGHQPKGL